MMISRLRIGLALGALLVATTAFGQTVRISKVGAEEFVSGDFMDRPSVSTDSKMQPHFVCDAGGNSRFMKYHKVNGKWSGGVFAIGSRGGRYNASRLYVGQMEIDGKDRAWISCKFGCKEFGNMLGQGIWLFRDVASNPNPPEQMFKHVNVYKGMGVVTTDAKYPDQGVVIGTFGNFRVLDTAGNALKSGSLNAGHGGEKVRARIGSYAPRFREKGDTKAYADGIWHTAMCGFSLVPASYQNSTRYKAGLGPVAWASYHPYSVMGDDYHHPGVQPDASDPRVAYIASIFYGKLCINIWDGKKMLFPTTNLKVLDYDCTFEGRHAVAIAPAPGPEGGAFFFWSKGGRIKTRYVSKKGVAGPIKDITAGRTAAATTDREGNIHLVYYSNGSRYRKISISSLEAITPAGVVTGTRQPTFRWTNTKVASYTLEIKQDGVTLPLQTVFGVNTWTPDAELAVGSYSWRVKEGNAGSTAKWSPAKAFVIPPVTPVTDAPVNRLGASPLAPRFSWICEDDAVTHFTIRIYKGTDLFDALTFEAPVDKAFEFEWPSALEAGSYSWIIRSTRTLAGYNASSPWSESLAFQIGVPGTCAITSPDSGDVFQPGQQTLPVLWTEADGATFYKVKLLQNGSLFAVVDNVAGLNQDFVDGFWPGHYTALVQPANNEGKGLWSPPVAFEVARLMRPGNGKTLDSAPGKFTWTRSRVATRYNVKLRRYNLKTLSYDVLKEKWVSQVPKSATPTWVHGLALPAGSYKWTVTDYDGKKALYTSSAYFQVKVPGKPWAVSPTGNTVGPAVECLWTDPSGVAKEFKVQVWQGKTKLRDTGFLPAADFVKGAAFSRTFTFNAVTGPLTWRVQGRNGRGAGAVTQTAFTLLAPEI